MINSLYDLKPGMLIEVQDCHHAEPHIYEVSRIEKDKCGRDITWAVSMTAGYHYNFNDITAVWERQGDDYVRVWVADPITRYRYTPKEFEEYCRAQWETFKEKVLAPFMKGETDE